MVFLIRKSMMDEATEYARCNDVDVAITICPPGFNVYDEDGNVMHTSIIEDKYKFGKKWIELKTTIEKELANYGEKSFINLLQELSLIKKYAHLLEEVLTLMNTTEIEDSNAINYESLWSSLKEKVEQKINKPSVQTVSDMVKEADKYYEFLNMMKEVEEGIKDE